MLLVHNQSGAPVSLTGISAPTLPASAAPPTRGPAVNVTSELRGLTGGQYTALEAQRIAVPLTYEWTDLPEYSVGTLFVETNATQTYADAGDAATLLAAERYADALFDPLLIAGCIFDYDPTRLVTLVSGLVSAWGDRTGSDVNKILAQAVAGSRPSFNASDAAYNNRPTIQSDGTRFMASPLWTAPQAQPLTIFAVGELDTAVPGHLFSGTSGAGNDTISNASSFHWAQYGGLAYNDTATLSSPAAIVCGVFDGVSSAIYVNDHATAGASGNTGANPITASSIFGYTNGTALGKGKIARAFGFNYDVDTALRGGIFAALSRIYGIATT